MIHDDTASVVRTLAGRYGVGVPDDDLSEVCETYVALCNAARRVLAAEPVEFGIAVTFDPTGL